MLPRACFAPRKASSLPVCSSRLTWSTPCFCWRNCPKRQLQGLICCPTTRRPSSQNFPTAFKGKRYWKMEKIRTQSRHRRPDARCPHRQSFRKSAIWSLHQAITLPQKILISSSFSPYTIFPDIGKMVQFQLDSLNMPLFNPYYKSLIIK